MSKHPNIVFILSDQMKWSALRMYSEIGIDTPGLERLAAEGVRFENAITPHPLCVPARVSMMTSRYAHSTGSRRNETPMPPGQLHAFRIWKEMGYTTGLFGKNHCFVQQSDLATLDIRCELSHTGLPRDDYLGEVAGAQGMEWVTPEDVINEAHQTRTNMPGGSGAGRCAITEHPLEGYSSAAVTTQVEAFLERASKGDRFDGSEPTGQQERPFAIWVSYPDPHSPYEVPKRYADMVPPESITLPPQREGEFAGPETPERNRVLYEMLRTDGATEEEVRRVVSVYLAMTRFIDDGIGSILGKLEALGLREDSIVVFISDHGDFAGEHGMMGKGGVFYDSLVRVPMIVSWPGGGVPQNVIDKSQVNLVDVLPTLLQLAGLADFTRTQPVAEGDDLPPAGPLMLMDTGSQLLTPERLRRLQGKPLPTVTGASPRQAAFSEYGAGGPPFTMAMLKKQPETHGSPAVMGSLWAREAEGRRKMVRTARWKYVTDPAIPAGNTPRGSSARNDDELYDLQSDPWELRNVALDPQNAAVISEMRALLAEWMAETEDPDPVPLPGSVGRGRKPVIDTSG
jgi:arylsulfatase A-like enzyme